MKEAKKLGVVVTILCLCFTMFFGIFIGMIFGTLETRQQVEDYNGIRIHMEYKEFKHFRYCPDCGKRLD